MNLFFEKFTSNWLKTQPDLRMGVLFIDLDGFKQVNDAYGHDVGDELLVHFGDLFKKCVREEDMVGRFGGDEFVIAVPQSNREIVEQIVQRILTEVRKPLVLAENEINTTVSVGIACYPDSGKSIDELIAAADRAMYVAKKSGKNNYIFVGDMEHLPNAADNNGGEHSVKMSNTV